MTDDSSSGGIAIPIVTIVIGLFFLGYSIALAIFFYRAREFANNNPSINPPISANTAIFLLWVSILMALVSMAIVIIYIVVLVHKTSANKSNSNNNKADNAQSRDKSNKIKDGDLTNIIVGHDCTKITDPDSKKICHYNSEHINGSEDCVNIHLPRGTSRVDSVSECKMYFNAKSNHK